VTQCTNHTQSMITAYKGH